MHYMPIWAGTKLEIQQIEIQNGNDKFRILEVGKLYFRSSPVQEAGKIGLKVLQIHETLNVPDMKFLITKFKTHQTFFLNLNAKYQTIDWQTILIKNRL